MILSLRPGIAAVKRAPTSVDRVSATVVSYRPCRPVLSAPEWAIAQVRSAPRPVGRPVTSSQADLADRGAATAPAAHQAATAIAAHRAANAIATLEVANAFAAQL